MTTMYPNDFDIYGFCPKEEKYGIGDLVVDRRTGVMGRINYGTGGEYTVKVNGTVYPISK